MNTATEAKGIRILNCGSNISYILQDSHAFLSTEYKVLQSQAKSGFVKCMKMTFNGQVQLFYLTDKMKPFSSLIPTLEPDNFLKIVGDMFAAILDVQRNGFLSCRNIDVAFHHVYVDPATFKVSLVYLPISFGLYEDASVFENHLRTELVKLITDVSSLSSPKTIQFCADLSNGNLTMEDLYKRIKSGVLVAPLQPILERNTDDNAAKTLCMTAMNAPARIQIKVDKPSFLIGKKVGMVDHVLSFNDKISRLHCRIECDVDGYKIIDLRSANGTYVNGTRLQSEVPFLLHNGDVVRLANSDFQVTIE